MWTRTRTLGAISIVALIWLGPRAKTDIASLGLSDLGSSNLGSSDLNSSDLGTAVGTAASIMLTAVCAYVLLVIFAFRKAQHSTCWTTCVRYCAPSVVRTLITASAATGACLTPAAHAIDGPHDVHGLDFPDRPMSPVSAASASQGNHAEVKHTVRHGENLWSIAADHLPSDANQDDIDRSWRIWWHTNRTAIGPNPDVIRPGQVLQHPEEKP